MPDDAKIVWKINNEQAAVIIPVEGTDESILVKAAVGGAATVTATVCDAENNPIKVKEESGEKIVRATCKVTVIPHITTVEIKNVKQPGAVAVGQTVQAQVNILGGDEYDYENYPKLTYQWYQKNNANPTAAPYKLPETDYYVGVKTPTLKLSVSGSYSCIPL